MLHREAAARRAVSPQHRGVPAVLGGPGRDHEGVSPNKNPLKKLSVVKQSVSDPTKQHLAFDAPAAAE